MNEGRDALNFSEYDKRHPRKARDAIETILEGSMPPSYYTWFGLHGEAKLAAVRALPALATHRAQSDPNEALAMLDGVSELQVYYYRGNDNAWSNAQSSGGAALPPSDPPKRLGDLAAEPAQVLDVDQDARSLDVGEQARILAARLGAARRVRHRGEGARLGHAVGNLHALHVHLVEDLLHDFGRADGASHDPGSQRRKVGRREVGVFELGNEHGGHAVEGGGFLLMDASKSPMAPSSFQPWMRSTCC